MAETVLETLVLKADFDISSAEKGVTKLNKTLSKIKGVTDKGSSGTKKLSACFSSFTSKVRGATAAFRVVSNTLGSWFKESNDYVEALNLFNVAMGDCAEAAMEYAKTVEAVMGIDLKEWLTYQGAFHQLATGYGIASSSAERMSENLTQLAYDLSSLWNSNVESAFQKLQSGMSGQIKGLKAWGVNVSVAQLRQTALAHGIDLSTAKMTEAQKATLRYITIMEQTRTAQGDLARTIATPSNALRILNAQWTQAKRAMGQIVSVIAVEVIPWFQALIRIIKEAAQSLANALGYKLPEIDYSGIEIDTGSFEDASDSLGEAADNAKELKKTLLGIDELNVMTDNSSSAADVFGGGYAPDFGLDLSEYDYDFLADVEDNVGDIYKKLKKLLKPIKTIFEYLYDYKEIVMAGLAIAALSKLWTAISNWWVSFKALKLVDAFLNGFYLIKATGGNVLQSVVGGLDNIRYNLTGIQKAAIVAVAGFVEFAVIRESVNELAKGCENAGAKIVEIGVVATAAGAAMYVALGPGGLALAAIVGITAAVVGFADAQSELRKELVDASFFDGVGVSLDSFKSKLELVTEAYRVQNQQIIEWKEQIDSNHETIDNIGLKIQTLSNTLGSTGRVTQDEIDEIKSQFDSLYECVSENMSLSEEVILTALVGAMQRATPEIAEQIDILIGEYQRYVRETRGRAEELKLLIDNGYDELVGKQKDDPAYQEIMANIQNWYTELGYLSGGMSDAGWQWQQTVTEFNNGEIDFGTSVEEVTDTLSGIADCGKTALEDLAIARDTVLKQIDEQIAYASKYGSLEDVSMLGDIRQNIEDDYAAQEEAIKGELNSIFESIQEGMIGKISDTKDSLEKEWDNMNWFEHWWYDHEEGNYVRSGLQDMQGHIDTISNAIQGHMNDLETNGSVWADDAMQGIIDTFFKSRVTRNDLTGSTTRYSYAMDLEEAINQVFSELEKSGKKASSVAGEEITNGLSEGMSAAAGAAAGAAKGVVSGMDDAVREAAQINSPSKLFATDAGYMVDGLIKGVQDKATELKNAVASAITSALSKSSATSYGNDFGKNLGNGIVSGFKGTSFPTLKGTVNVTDGGSVSLKLKAYATGGFPTTGEMFIAREAGPEMVGTIGNKSAVVNNEQIIAGISEGVADANSEQNALLREQNNLLRKLLEKDSVVNAVVGANDIIGGIQKKNRRDGKTIVPVGY